MTRPALGDLVMQFHDVYGLQKQALPSADVPPDLARLRLGLIAEEVGELGDAVARGDIVAIADALADITYVVFGAAISYGIDLDAVVREVHRSNLSKLDADGKPVFREDGKVLKSELYSPPDVRGVLEAQRPLF